MRRCFSVLVLASAFVALSAARDEEKKLTAVQIARKGKAATALVECDLQFGKRHGSAFCIRASGLFVTNEHVVKDATAIRVILDPSLGTQKVVKAKVFRLDSENDLALLQVEDVKDLPVLELGNTAGIEELMEIVACGFPFGLALTVVKEEYPAVSINKGTITSLRRKDGELHRIQVDAVLNPGNSGGPILDREGKVIGVVVTGVRGTAVSFVIPVGILSRLLEKPELGFSAPTVSRKKMHDSATFEAKAIRILPGKKALDLELVLTVGGKARKFAMKRDGDVYRASAVPVPAVEGPIRVRAALTYREGTVSGAVRDRGIKIGGKERKLSEIRAIRNEGKSTTVEFLDGSSATTALEATDELEIDLGGEKLRLKLALPREITIEPPALVTEVECVVVARSGNQVVGEVSDFIFLPDESVKRIGVVPPRLDANKVAITLPADANDAVMAGGGRYLLLRLPSLSRLAVFDVSAAKLIGHMPLVGEKSWVGGGQSKVVIVPPGDATIERWDLATLKREKSAKLALLPKHTIKHLAMGCASEGPIVYTASNYPMLGDTGIIDLNTLAMRELKNRSNWLHSTPDSVVRASAEGQVFGAFCFNSWGFQSLVVGGSTVPKLHAGSVGVGHITPGEDGRFLYTAKGVYTADCGTTGLGLGLYCLPAVRGPYFLGMKLHARGQEQHDCSVFFAGDRRPLFEVKEVEWPAKMNEWDREAFANDRRIWFVPEAKVLITIPSANRVVLHRLDVDKELDRSKVEYLGVVSRPANTKVSKGAVFTYPLQVKSRRGSVQYKLVNAPEGMLISNTGLISWKVPADFPEKEVAVVVGLDDPANRGGRYHFRLTVE